MNNKLSVLFILLGILICLDYLTTYISIIKLGAIELNPIFKMCNNLYMFFSIKFIITLIGLYILYYYRHSLEHSVYVSLIILNILYICVVLSNLNQMYF